MSDLDRVRRLRRPALLVKSARLMARTDRREIPPLAEALRVEAEIEEQRRGPWNVTPNATHVAALALVIRAARAEAAAPLSLVK